MFVDVRWCSLMFLENQRWKLKIERENWKSNVNIENRTWKLKIEDVKIENRKWRGGGWKSKRSKLKIEGWELKIDGKNWVRFAIPAEATRGKNEEVKVENRRGQSWKSNVKVENRGGENWKSMKIDRTSTKIIENQRKSTKIDENRKSKIENWKSIMTIEHRRLKIEAPGVNRTPWARISGSRGLVFVFFRIVIKISTFSTPLIPFEPQWPN